MTALNDSNLEAPPIELCRIDGVAGILLQQDGQILINDFPLSAEQAERIAYLTRKMCEGYRKARRVLRQIIIGYPCGQLIVISRDDSQLVLLLLEESSLNEVSEAGAAYLNERTKKPLRLPQTGLRQMQ